MEIIAGLIAWALLAAAVAVGPALAMYILRHPDVKWRVYLVSILLFWGLSGTVELIVVEVLQRPHGAGFLFAGWGWGAIYCYPWFLLGRAMRKWKLLDNPNPSFVERNKMIVEPFQVS